MSRPVEIPEGLLTALEHIGAATGQSIEELVERSLSEFIVSKQNVLQEQKDDTISLVKSGRKEANDLVSDNSSLLYISEPIIDLVKGGFLCLIRTTM
jgi:hypothetical protein